MIQELEISECLNVLSANYIGRLAYISGENPYIVPITYFYDITEKSILSYSANGYKIEAMRKHKEVALQVDDIQSIQNWRSVLAHGDFEELQGSTAKKYLRKFAEGVQDTIVKVKGVKPKFIQDYSSRLQSRTIPIIYRIRISNITGKRREDS